LERKSLTNSEPKTMPDDTLTFAGTIEPQELVSKLREKEDLFFRLVSCAFDSDAGMNSFGFDSHLDVPEPDPKDFLEIDLFADIDDDQQRTALKKNFADFGGSIVADGILRIRGQDVYAILFRGPEPEFPTSHGPSQVIPPPSAIPAHAQAIFSSGGELAGIPWNLATTVKMPLQGMKDNRMMIFKGATGKIIALILVTDADIDTDGPGGNKAIDPTYGSGTSLTFPNGAYCNSRLFPGVVRSPRLHASPFGLKLGDFAYICYNGKVVACQIYDQGPDDKIGEISIFAAREVGGIPQNKSEHWAATAGNFTNELVTVCFPGSSAINHALSNPEISAGARHALEEFIGAIAAPSTLPLSPSNQVPDPAVPTPLFIYSRAIWGALEPKVSSFKPAQASGIVIHNTEDANRTPLAGTAERDAAFELSRRIQHSHMFDRGWSDTGQHFTISRGGVVMEGRAGTLPAAHNGQVVRGAHAGVALYNNQWWGIELEGDFRQSASDLTSEQQAALSQLCEWLSSLITGFDPTQQVKVHRQVKPGGTDCPGKLLDPAAAPDFLTQLRNHLATVHAPFTAPTIV
jgi:N-acetylmuramoyl-L-alanine amidase